MAVVNQNAVIRKKARPPHTPPLALLPNAKYPLNPLNPLQRCGCCCCCCCCFYPQVCQLSEFVRS